jgi:excisionase family DNA binding protein
VSDTRLTLDVPPDLVEAIAQRAAEIVAARLGPAEREPWMNSEQAAAYLGCKRQRIHELVHERRLTYRKDGSRLLFRPSDLERYVERGA